MVLIFLILLSFVSSTSGSDLESDVESLGAAGVEKALRKPETYQDDSDREDAVLDEKPFDSVNLPEQPGAFFSSIVDTGIQVKLLTNVYLRNLDEKANVFVAFFRAMISTPDGRVEEKADYFRHNGKICVFASGGFHNAWEKSTQRVYEAFYNSKIKIIRGAWIQKHLYKDYKESEKFERTPVDELHSELYYKIFFERFFPTQLKSLKKEGEVLGIAIDAFSWWDVCDGCYKHNLPSKLGSIPIAYRIKSARPYRNSYRDTESFKSRVLVNAEERENKSWLSLWDKIKELSHKKFPDEDSKRVYWTATFTGIELTKWLGQAFVENKTPGKKGDVLRHYQELESTDKDQLQGLIDYLKEENWELSCWYSHPFPRGPIQKKWKKHWLELVMPHFGWREVLSDHLESDTTCEMCGCEKARKISYIYHQKYRSAKCSAGSNEAIRFSGDPLPPKSEELRKFKVKSLVVGSKCIETLILTKEQLKSPRKVAAEQAKRDKSYFDLDMAEKELKKKAAEKRKEEARIKKEKAEKKKQERLLKKQAAEKKKKSKKPSRKTSTSADLGKADAIAASTPYKTANREKYDKKRGLVADEATSDSDSSGLDDDGKKIDKAPSIKRLAKQRRTKL